VRGFRTEILTNESAETANKLEEKYLLAPLKLHTFRFIRRERDRRVKIKKWLYFSVLIRGMDPSRSEVSQ
jgi:hypothetical protein